MSIIELLNCQVLTFSPVISYISRNINFLPFSLTLGNQFSRCVLAVLFLPFKWGTNIQNVLSIGLICTKHDKISHQTKYGTHLHVLLWTVFINTLSSCTFGPFWWYCCLYSTVSYKQTNLLLQLHPNILYSFRFDSLSNSIYALFIQ